MSSNAELSSMVNNLVKSGAVAGLDVKADGTVHMDFRQMEPAANDAHAHAPAANQPQFAVAGMSAPTKHADAGRLNDQMDALVKAGLMDATHQQAMTATLQQHGVDMSPKQHQAHAQLPVHHDKPAIVGDHTARFAAANQAQMQQAANGPAR